MSWIITIALALAAFALIVLVFKAPRPTWEAIGAVLALGIAGYALQGHPSMAGAPKFSDEGVKQSNAALVAARKELFGKNGSEINRWLVISDAMSRNGRHAEAADILRAAVIENPKDAESWVAMGNALVAHAEGSLSPAARYAFTQARESVPQHPAPAFFYGLALAQSGMLLEGREEWVRLLQNTPLDAPWRPEVIAQLQRLDAFILEAQKAVAEHK